LTPSFLDSQPAPCAVPDEYAAVLLKVGKQGNAASTLVDEDAGVQCDANAGIEHCAGSLEAAKVLRGLNMAEPRTFLGRYGSVSGRPRAAAFGHKPTGRALPINASSI